MDLVGKTRARLTQPSFCRRKGGEIVKFKVYSRKSYRRVFSRNTQSCFQVGVIKKQRVHDWRMTFT